MSSGAVNDSTSSDGLALDLRGIGGSRDCVCASLPACKVARNVNSMYYIQTFLKGSTEMFEHGKDALKRAGAGPDRVTSFIGLMALLSGGWAGAQQPASGPQADEGETL